MNLPPTVNDHYSDHFRQGQSRPEDNGSSWRKKFSLGRAAPGHLSES
jgi:hypothetical protein